MPEVSAAIVLVAGTILVLAGVIPSPMTDASRQRLVGWGYLIATLALVAWMISFAVSMLKIVKTL
jgi:hypothetical protein